GCRRACGRRRDRASSGWPSGCAQVSCGRTRSTGSIRRARSAATRNRASAARVDCTGSSRTSRSRASPDPGPVVVEVRLATPGDEAALAALDLSTWNTLSSPAPRPDPKAGWTFFGERARPEDVLVATVGGKIAGYVKLGRSNP